MRYPAFLFSFLLCSFLYCQDSFSSVLPIIVIDTLNEGIPNEPKVTASMGIINNGNGEQNRLADERNEYNGFIGIELRGSSSLSFPKNGFGLETRTEAGEDLAVELLGMPREEDWVLHGPFSDKSLIRNALAYELAGSIMPYAPRFQLVELVLNGDYWGVYLFTEKVKRDKNRVDVKKVKPHFAAGDSLTGGYILKVDRYGGETDQVPTFFESAYNADNGLEQLVRIVYHYPKPDDLTPVQRDYISGWVNDFEHALASDEFTDPVLGYRPYVDLQSFIDFLLINEISRNVDGYRLSTYLYKKRDSKGGKLHMGPVWDFNLGFGNADYCNGGDVEGWAYDFGEECPNDFFQLPFWWSRLLEDPDFVTLLADRWQNLRAGVFSDEALNTAIDSLVMMMGDAPARNFDRWPALEQYVWPNPFVGGNYPAEIDYLKNWLSDRTAWMDGAISALTPVRRLLPAATLTLSPNPTDGRLRFLDEVSGELFDVKVYDTYGRLIFSDNRLAEGVSIDLSAFPAGIYLLQARRGNGEVITGRVVKR